MLIVKYTHVMNCIGGPRVISVETLSPVSTVVGVLLKIKDTDSTRSQLVPPKKV